MTECSLVHSRLPLQSPLATEPDVKGFQVHSYLPRASIQDLPRQDGSQVSFGRNRPDQPLPVIRIACMFFCALTQPAQDDRDRGPRQCRLQLCYIGENRKDIPFSAHIKIGMVGTSPY
jgi:hypothetical protein